MIRSFRRLGSLPEPTLAYARAPARGVGQGDASPYLWKLFSRRGRARRVPVFVCACILSLVFAPAAPALAYPSSARDASEREFIWNEANARMQTARTGPDYLEAAKIYQRLIDDGVRNGPLFYNIGTAMLAAGLDAQAFSAFERAERYFGRQADNDQNLKIAFAKKTKSRTVFFPWYRLAAFWHFYLSCPQRTSIASCAFLIFWLALALKYALSPQRSLGRFTTGLVLRKTGIKRATDTIALFSLAVFIIFATSVAASWQMESTVKRYNLIFPQSSATTNAPARASAVQL